MAGGVVPMKRNRPQYRGEQGRYIEDPLLRAWEQLHPDDEGLTDELQRMRTRGVQPCGGDVLFRRREGQ